MDIRIKPMEEINSEALRLLFNEIGLVNTIRFINNLSQGYGDYTKEREKIFSKYSLEEIVSQIKKKEKIK